MCILVRKTFTSGQSSDELFTKSAYNSIAFPQSQDGTSLASEVPTYPHQLWQFSSANFFLCYGCSLIYFIEPPVTC